VKIEALLLEGNLEGLKMKSDIVIVIKNFLTFILRKDK